MTSLAKLGSIGFICLGLLAGPAYSKPPADASGGVLPVVQGQGSLTVSGDGYWHRQTYQAGEQPVLSPYSSDGQLLPDGQYRYELRMVPENSKSVARQQDVLRGKSSTAGFNRQPPVSTVDGQFEIQGGQVVFP
jgi:hypothetical protein